MHTFGLQVPYLIVNNAVWCSHWSATWLGLSLDGLDYNTAYSCSYFLIVSSHVRIELIDSSVLHKCLKSLFVIVHWLKSDGAYFQIGWTHHVWAVVGVSYFAEYAEIKVIQLCAYYRSQLFIGKAATVYLTLFTIKLSNIFSGLMCWMDGAAEQSQRGCIQGPCVAQPSLTSYCILVQQIGASKLNDQICCFSLALMEEVHHLI